MPDLQALGLTVNPSNDPVRYPGAVVTSSCLLTASWLYPLEARRGQEVGAWTLSIGDGPLNETGSGRFTLDSVLDRTGEAVTSSRHAVLAVGSNAAPGQLTHKFSVASCSRLVPMTRVTVRGLDVAHSAHVSKAGYVPYAPAAAGTETARDLVILWLDNAQITRINETEANYNVATINGEAHPAELESGERLPAYKLYRSRWGLLRLSPTALPAPAMSQPQVFAALCQLAWFRDLVPECTAGAVEATAALRADSSRRDRVRDSLAGEELTTGDGLDAS